MRITLFIVAGEITRFQALRGLCNAVMRRACCYRRYIITDPGCVRGLRCLRSACMQVTEK